MKLDIITMLVSVHIIEPPLELLGQEILFFPSNMSL